jgi:hypothetical protein
MSDITHVFKEEPKTKRAGVLQLVSSLCIDSEILIRLGVQVGDRLELGTDDTVGSWAPHLLSQP